MPNDKAITQHSKLPDANGSRTAIRFPGSKCLLLSCDTDFATLTFGSFLYKADRACLPVCDTESSVGFQYLQKSFSIGARSYFQRLVNKNASNSTTDLNIG